MKPYKGMRIAFAGFCTAAIGGVITFCGFGIEQRWLAIAGYLIALAGVVLGIAGIVYSWVTVGRQAVTGSLDAAKKLRDSTGTGMDADKK